MYKIRVMVMSVGTYVCVCVCVLDMRIEYVMQMYETNSEISLWICFCKTAIRQEISIRDGDRFTFP